MEISKQALELAADALAKAGFDVKYSRRGEIRSAQGRNCAFVGVSGASLYGLDSEGKNCTAEVVISANLLCGQKEFRGAEEFAKMCENAAAGLYFGSPILIKSVRLCGITQNMRLGRLEQRLEITAAYTVAKEAEQ